MDEQRWLMDAEEEMYGAVVQSFLREINVESKRTFSPIQGCQVAALQLHPTDDNRNSSEECESLKDEAWQQQSTRQNWGQTSDSRQCYHSEEHHEDTERLIEEKVDSEIGCELQDVLYSAIFRDLVKELTVQADVHKLTEERDELDIRSKLQNEIYRLESTASRFTMSLNELLESDDKFGFIVMDGNGTLFGTLSGNTREVLHKFTVELPKKHGRGGQSALRFARLRMEKRHNYVRKTAELATQFFINPATSQPNVAGLILAGSADFKTELSQSDMFDQRLQAKILNVVDVSYGGENGFNQAIELSAEILANVKFIQEKKLIGKYFEEISQDTGKYVFGVDDTLKALENGCCGDVESGKTLM